jgi:2-alkyl-3-oxoalkanoate reductase
MSQPPIKALVTGGGGFLGGAIIRKLIERGDTVRSFQRSKYNWHKKRGVESIQGDLADRDAVSLAVQGVDVVFHVAAKAGVWGSHESYLAANVTGTDNVLTACRDHQVKHFVYTSSPSVVYAGKDENGIDESVPYPDTYLTHYPETKAIAERRVLASNGDTMATTSLRPHLIWGPGDQHLAPRIISRAKAGKLKLVGDGSNLVDSTYIDNAVHAHLLAVDLLIKQGKSAPCAGKAYFISNGEPLAMADLINRILDAGGRPPVMKSVSPRVAYAAGFILETMYKWLGKTSEPIMTRFVAKQLSTAHWFNLDNARNDLGYTPAVSIDDGMTQLKTWLSNQ